MTAEQVWGLLLGRAAGLLLTWLLRCGFRIAEGQKIESQMCFKLDSLIVDPPCELPSCCEGGNRVICMPQGEFTTLDAKSAGRV